MPFFQLREGIDGEGFDFRDHHIGTVAPYNLQKSLGIGHGQDLRLISDLHGWSTAIAITGDHPASQSLGCDHNLLTEFSTSQKHHGARKEAHDWFRLQVKPINQSTGRSVGNRSLITTMIQLNFAVINPMSYH